MGRKIPARKHKGVRNPEEQQRQRDAKLKNKINAPPSKNGDDEPLPKSLQELMKLRQLVKEGKIKEGRVKKKRKSKAKTAGEAPVVNNEGHRLLSSADFIGPNEPLQPGMKRPDKQIPVVEQRPWEKDRSFLYRVNQLCQEVLKETQFEEKFGVDVVRNSETGEVKIKKKGKDEVDEIMKEETKKVQKAKDPKKAKQLRKIEEKQAAAKEERLKRKKNRSKLKREKLIQKKIQKKEDKKGFVAQEVVKFGEVADRPPELKVRPRKSVPEKDLKSLMFNQMIIQGKKEEEEKKQNNSQNISKKQNLKSLGKSVLTGKRKDLPASQRRQLEQQQTSVIAAYRLMKKNRALTQHQSANC